jgi:hypothetical protein
VTECIPGSRCDRRYECAIRSPFAVLNQNSRFFVDLITCGFSNRYCDHRMRGNQSQSDGVARDLPPLVVALALGLGYRLSIQYLQQIMDSHFCNLHDPVSDAD